MGRDPGRGDDAGRANGGRAGAPCQYAGMPVTPAAASFVLQFADAHDDTVFVSPSSEAMSLAIPGDGLFRMAPSTSTGAPAVVANLEQQDKEYAVAICRNDAWGRGDMPASIKHEVRVHVLRRFCA